MYLCAMQTKSYVNKKDTNQNFRSGHLKAIKSSSIKTTTENNEAIWVATTPFKPFDPSITTSCYTS